MKPVDGTKPVDFAAAVEGLLAAVETMRRDFELRDALLPSGCASVIEAAARLEAMISRGPVVGRPSPKP